MEKHINPTLPFALLLILLGLTAVVPASWFTSPAKKVGGRTALDMQAILDAGNVAKDADKNGVLTWGEVIGEVAGQGQLNLEEITRQPVKEEVIAQLNDPNNLTASFSKNLLTSSLSLKKANIIDETAKLAVVKNLLEQEVSRVSSNIYSSKDLNISQNENVAAIKTYGNLIAPILKDLISVDIIAKDLEAINSFSQTKDSQSLAVIKKNELRVELLLEKALKISVPSSAAPYHLILINRLSAYKETLADIATSPTDPLRGTFAVQNYTKVVVMLLRIPSVLTDYFNLQNVVFSSKEAGYIFTTGYTYN